jgi:chromosome segregation ATPase
MSKLWDDLKKQVKEWSSTAVEKAEEVSKIAVAKTEELTKIGKIKIEIRQLEREMAKTYERLGHLVYSAAKEKKLDFSKDDDVAGYVGQVDELKAAIAAKEEQVRRIKEEYDLKEADIAAVEKDVEKTTDETSEESESKGG